MEVAWWSYSSRRTRSREVKVSRTCSEPDRAEPYRVYGNSYLPRKISPRSADLTRFLTT